MKKLEKKSIEKFESSKLAKLSAVTLLGGQTNTSGSLTNEHWWDKDSHKECNCPTS